MDRELYEARAEVIKALAHPTRLMIVDILAEGETCVCDIQRLVGGDLSTVSKHLAVLKNAGIVKARKEGLQVFYRLHVPCITGFFGCVEAVLDAGRGQPVSAERPDEAGSCVYSTDGAGAR